MKLLVIELWGLGDLALATPFLNAAAGSFDVSLLAKPVACELQERLWPNVEVIPFNAPWTAFKGKYRFHRWPWASVLRACHTLRKKRFDFVVSGRWDPRDHVLLTLTGCSHRIGFGRIGSERLLTQPLPHPKHHRHRADDWVAIAGALGLQIRRNNEVAQSGVSYRRILVHTGAAHRVRVWPLNRYAALVHRLQSLGFDVTVACDQDQYQWWLEHHAEPVLIPANLTQLLSAIDRACLFIGNDSGPGHLAAACGIPTFTIFGNNLPELFAPQHERSRWIAGKPCPYKPCFDTCRFSVAHCMEQLSFEEVSGALDLFLEDQVSPTAPT